MWGHGKCRNTESRFMCMFDINWVSAKCSSIDLCSNLPCGEHGICQNNPHNFTCLCDDGFIRDQCKYNFCVLRYYIFVFLYRNPCKNNGTCISYFNGYECNCKRM